MVLVVGACEDHARTEPRCSSRTPHFRPKSLKSIRITFLRIKSRTNRTIVKDPPAILLGTLLPVPDYAVKTTEAGNPTSVGTRSSMGFRCLVAEQVS